MQYILSIGLIIVSLIYPKSKKVAILNLFFMWIIISFNYYNADYNNYIKIYNNPSIIADLGFGLMCRIFQSIGFSYNTMLGVISAICLSLLYRVFHRMSDKVALVTALYFIFPFFADAIQIRNFIAMSIVLFSLKYLDENNSRLHIVLYYICIFIAISFHVLAIVYLALPLINKLSIKLNIILGIIGALSIGGFFKVIGMYFPRMNEYFGTVEVWKAVFYMLPFVALLLIGIYLSVKHENDKISNRMNKLIIKGSIYLFMYNVLLLINLNYHRIFRNFIPILDVQFAELFKRKLNLQKFILLCLLIATILLKVILGWEDRVELLTYNYFFEIFQ